jgi:hypothetical protein
VSEERIADYDFLKKLPKITGKKTVKIELFHVGQFKSTWSDSKTKNFKPDIPYKFEDRNLYWTAGLYRVRIAGSWYAPEAKYTFLNWQEILELLKEELHND